MKRGRIWHKYEDRIIRSVQDFQFSKTFGWTPDQINSLSDGDRLVYLTLMSNLGGENG